MAPRSGGFRSCRAGTPHWVVDPRQFDRFGRTHHGLVTLDAAAAAGLPRDRWHRHLVGSDQLERVHRGVARVLGAPSSREQRILAAVLAAGGGAMASHRSSAHLWGVERPPDDPIDVLLVGRTRRARLEGVEVHRPRDLDDLRPVVRHGVPTTNPLRLLLDLGAVDAEGVTPALRHLVLAGFVTPLVVSAALDRHARRGRSGVGPLRTALERWMIDGRPSDSELEQRMAAVARRFGLPRLRFHPVLAGHEVDFAIEGTCLVIECDGWSTHGADRAQFERDRARDADLTAAGHIVVRVTWRHLFSRPQPAAERIARNVWQWAPDVAAAHLATRPTSILGATRPC